MSTPRLAIAAGNYLGTEAAVRVASEGGNAVDACLASAIMAWVAEPTFASVGGAGFVMVRTPDGSIEAIDGNNAMPLAAPTEPGRGVRRVHLDYSDGMETGMGAGSIAVPGMLKATHLAWERHGRIEWPALLRPAIEASRAGIDMPLTSAYYLSVTWENLWSAFPESRAVFAPRGALLREGDRFAQPELADVLELIADDGPDVFYSGELAAEMVDRIQALGGLMSAHDLKGYQAIVRRPLETDAFGWRVFTNPPPAVGGVVLAHMLALIAGADLSTPVARLKAVIEAQHAAGTLRREQYLDPGNIAAAYAEAHGKGTSGSGPASTTHSSAADADGWACSVTESAGYGSGLLIHGVVMNNTLGEEELNPLGVHALPPGSRCHSNMAPTIAEGPGVTVAIGSPGADRIVTAVTQALLRLAIDGEGLAEAIAAPRAHLEARPQGLTLCYEPGLPAEELGYIPRPYRELHMYFGAVQAASVTAAGEVDAAHDPRRSGGSALI
ncbi:gamma-glutamyltransferase [soil metagenome]